MFWRPSEMTIVIGIRASSIFSTWGEGNEKIDGTMPIINIIPKIILGPVLSLSDNLRPFKNGKIKAVRKMPKLVEAYIDSRPALAK